MRPSGTEKRCCYALSILGGLLPPRTLLARPFSPSSGLAVVAVLQQRPILATPAIYVCFNQRSRRTRAVLSAVLVGNTFDGFVPGATAGGDGRVDEVPPSEAPVRVHGVHSDQSAWLQVAGSPRTRCSFAGPDSARGACMANVRSGPDTSRRRRRYQQSVAARCDRLRSCGRAAGGGTLPCASVAHLATATPGN